MREKVLIFGSNFSLATRIADLVRREFEVILFEFSNFSKSDRYEVSTEFTGDLLNHALALNGARYVVFTSESLQYIHSPSVMSGLLSELRTCKLMPGTHLAWVDIEEPIVADANRCIQVLQNGSAYGKRINQVRQALTELADSVLQVQSVYTQEEDHWSPNFLRLLFDSKGGEHFKIRKPYGDWEALSADEVATALVSRLGQVGTYRLTNGPYHGGLEAFCKAASLEHKRWLKSHSISRPTHGDQSYIDTNLKKVSMHAGLYSITRQTHCSVNYLYRKAPEAAFGLSTVATLRHELGYALAKSIPREVANELDMIVPVPETGKVYAKGLSIGLGLPYVEAIFKSDLKRSFDIESFDERREFLFSRLSVLPGVLAGKRVMVVDEAIFTGATLKVVSHLLQEEGVSCIYYAIPTPEARYGCNFNMLPKRSLLSEYVRKEDLWVYFNVRGVFFQDEKYFIQSIDQFGPQCVACFIHREANDTFS